MKPSTRLSDFKQIKKYHAHFPKCFGICLKQFFTVAVKTKTKNFPETNKQKNKREEILNTMYRKFIRHNKT